MDIRHTVRIGLFYLEEAILEVLAGTNEPLTAKEIAKELGIVSLRGPDKDVLPPNPLVESFLAKFLVDKRVETIKVGPITAWRVPY